MPEEELSTSTPRRRTRRSSGGESRSSDGATSTSIGERRGGRRKRTASGLQQIFVDVLGWGIFALWAVGFGVDMANLVPDWDLPAGIWGLMTIVSGGAFVANAIKKPGEAEG